MVRNIGKEIDGWKKEKRMKKTLRREKDKNIRERKMSEERERQRK